MILLDTQTIVWMGVGDRRLSPVARLAIESPANRVHISAVTAYEFADLNRRERFGADLQLDDMIMMLSATLLDYPADCWRLATGLPHIHRDPVDRMMIAHAIQADLTLITADETIRTYPVRTLW